MTLGSHIAALRAARGLSQAELAEQLEVSRQSVSKWETDASVPELDKLTHLSQIFGVTLDELVTGAASKSDAPRQAAHTPEPARDVSRQPLRVTVGSALLLFGALLALIFSLQGNQLRVVIMVALPFLSCGMVCMLFLELLPLWCGWCVFLWIEFCNDLFPVFFWYNEVATLLAVLSLPLLTGWCLRNRLFGSIQRRRLLLGGWLAGAVIFQILWRVGLHFYCTVVIALSQSENNRRQRFGFVMLKLSELLALVLLSIALAALFYGLGRLRKKLLQKRA